MHGHADHDFLFRSTNRCGPRATTSRATSAGFKSGPWEDLYRVNALVGGNAASAKIAHNYFLVADRDGDILESTRRSRGSMDRDPRGRRAWSPPLITLVESQHGRRKDQTCGTQSWLRTLRECGAGRALMMS